MTEHIHNWSILKESEFTHIDCISKVPETHTIVLLQCQSCGELKKVSMNLDHLNRKL